MNRQNLDLLIAHFHRLADPTASVTVGFNMASFAPVEGLTDHSPHNCRTVCGIAGHAALFFDGDCPNFADWLGVDPRLVLELVVWPDRHLPSISLSDAIETLERLRDTGEVWWSWQWGWG